MQGKNIYGGAEQDAEQSTQTKIQHSSEVHELRGYNVKNGFHILRKIIL